jgi:hypothetical protein
MGKRNTIKSWAVPSLIMEMVFKERHHLSSNKNQTLYPTTSRPQHLQIITPFPSFNTIVEET